MKSRARMIRQTLTIARRDFTATVFTPLFLLFLLSPLIMISFGLVGALGGSTLARGPADKSRLVAIAAASDRAAIADADARARKIFRPGDAPPELVIQPATADPEKQARAAFNSAEFEASAVLYGPLASPTILYGARGSRVTDYLAELAERVLRDRAGGVSGALSHPTKAPMRRIAASASGHGDAAFVGVVGIFFLTLFLSGQVVGTMAEERGNKVVEILAAAVPLEAVFLGKLLGMFGVAVLFVTFWGTLISQIGHIVPGGAGPLSDFAPAIGLPMFIFLFCAYFTMAYMLLGAVFLSVGAQASTMREIQMLSLPITVTQMVMFAWAASAASRPGTLLALGAELFPLSSPYAMAAHAGNEPAIWPHIAALAWQLLWVSLTIAIGASAFRRGVLKSGSGRKPLRAIFRRA